MWGTLCEQVELDAAFAKLPWSAARGKPSLKTYSQAVADARNSAFHNLFPFDKSLRYDLPVGALQDAALILFPQYGSKNEEQLTFRDKELVDVLLEFTRARERRLPPEFWRRNLDVMDATISLFDATSAFLHELYADAADELEAARARTARVRVANGAAAEAPRAAG
jgi:hypothetical protein